MASQVLSGASNASYTNNTGQNVRLIINYMSNVTSMTWAGVTVTASSTTIGKDIQNVTGELRSVTIGNLQSQSTVSWTDINGQTRSTRTKTYDVDISQKAKIGYVAGRTGQAEGPIISILPTNAGSDRVVSNPSGLIDSRGLSQDVGYFSFANIKGDTAGSYVYVPTTISRGGNFPVELMLANGQSFSSVCGAYNAIVIKEDGT